MRLRVSRDWGDMCSMDRCKHLISFDDWLGNSGEMLALIESMFWRKAFSLLVILHQVFAPSTMPPVCFHPPPLPSSLISFWQTLLYSCILLVYIDSSIYLIGDGCDALRPDIIVFAR